jgi:hypothetical protein
LGIRLNIRLIAVVLVAAIQLNIFAINGFWFREFSYASQIKFEMAFGLSEIDWLSIGTDVSGFFREGHGLLDCTDVNSLSAIFDRDKVQECENSKRDLH